MSADAGSGAVAGRDNPGPPAALLRVTLGNRNLTEIRPLAQRALTAHVMLCEASSDESGHLPPALRRELLLSMGPSSRDAYRLIGGARATFRPSAVVPDCSGPRWATAAREAVREASVTQLRRELTFTLGADIAWRRRWASVYENPRPWLRAIGDGLSDAAPVIDRFCGRLGGSIDREHRRLDVAWESAAEVRHVLDGVSDHFTSTPDKLQVASRCGMEIRVPGDLLIAPVIGPAPVRLLVDRGDDLIVMYSLASTAAFATRTPTPRATRPLNALLGPTRAAVLLALNRPKSMGDLAHELGHAPSTITHHVRRLVAAELVVTQRSHKSVLVERTLTGYALIDMLGRDN